MDYIKNFAFGKGIRADIYCRFRDTRSGFAHDCVIPSLGVRATVRYYNRTWESYNFQSVLHQAIRKYVKENLGLHGKKNEKEFEKVYRKLAKRVDTWHSKGKMKFQRDTEYIFG